MNLSEALKIIKKVPSGESVCKYINNGANREYCKGCPVYSFKRRNTDKYGCHDDQRNFIHYDKIIQHLPDVLPALKQRGFSVANATLVLEVVRLAGSLPLCGASVLPLHISHSTCNSFAIESKLNDLVGHGLISIPTSFVR